MSAPHIYGTSYHYFANPSCVRAVPGGQASTTGNVVIALEIERSSKVNHPQLVLAIVRLTPGRRARLTAVARDAAVGAPPQHARVLCARGGRAEAAALATRVAA